MQFCANFDILLDHLYQQISLLLKEKLLELIYVTCCLFEDLKKLRISRAFQNFQYEYLALDHLLE